MFFFFQAEDGIRDLVRSRGLGDVYKRQVISRVSIAVNPAPLQRSRNASRRDESGLGGSGMAVPIPRISTCNAS